MINMCFNVLKFRKCLLFHHKMFKKYIYIMNIHRLYTYICFCCFIIYFDNHPNFFHRYINIFQHQVSTIDPTHMTLTTLLVPLGTPIPTPGVPYLQSGRIGPPRGIPRTTLRKVDAVLEELGVTKSPLPTKRSCDVYDNARGGALALVALRGEVRRRDSELNRLRTRLTRVLADVARRSGGSGDAMGSNNTAGGSRTRTGTSGRTKQSRAAAAAATMHSSLPLSTPQATKEVGAGGSMITAVTTNAIKDTLARGTTAKIMATSTVVAGTPIVAAGRGRGGNTGTGRRRGPKGSGGTKRRAPNKRTIAVAPSPTSVKIGATGTQSLLPPSTLTSQNIVPHITTGAAVSTISMPHSVATTTNIKHPSVSVPLLASPLAATDFGNGAILMKKQQGKKRVKKS